MIHSKSGSRTKSTPPRDRMATELDRIHRRLLCVATRLAKLEELADAAVAELDAVRERCRPDRGESPRAELRRIREIKRCLDRRCEILAEHGTADFSMKLMADGTAAASIDGKPVRLSATLAALLAVLATDNGRGDGPLIGWQSLQEISEQLTLRLGRVIRTGALRQNISRLRAKLEEAEIDRFLVQTQGSRARFALRRTRSATLSASPAPAPAQAVSPSPSSPASRRVAVTG